jgi:phosphatidate cytidylyltransferase
VYPAVVKERVLTALALIPPVLAALFLSSPYAIGLLAFAVAVIGSGEIKRMLRDESRYPTWLGAVLMMGPVLSLISGERANRFALAGAGALLFVIGIMAAYVAARRGTGRPSLSILASAWVAGPLTSLMALHAYGSATGLWSFATPVLLAIVPLWGGDTAAIFAGKAWGKHPLAPTISPKKTWEGSIANLLACVAVAVPLAVWIGYPWPIGLACGLAAGLLGQAGDLFESYVKRKADLKDSGTLLPGHGGIMDRIDSILFTAPAVALVVGVVVR